MPSVQSLALPHAPLYRVGWPPDPFVPPEWRYARPDGTFGGRYDDPRGRRGAPPSDRYRLLYVASHPAGAYGETVAQFRPSMKLLARFGGRMPIGRVPSIPRDWRLARRLGVAVLFATWPVVDLDAAETIQALRPILAPVAVRLGIPDIDVSATMGPTRDLTQEMALHLYNQADARGRPLYAGIRYTSRLNHTWECWAIFADRVRARPLRVDLIAADDPHLYEAARILALALEDDHGTVVVPS